MESNDVIKDFFRRFDSRWAFIIGFIAGAYVVSRPCEKEFCSFLSTPEKDVIPAIVRIDENFIAVNTPRGEYIVNLIDETWKLESGGFVWDPH